MWVWAAAPPYRECICAPPGRTTLPKLRVMPGDVPVVPPGKTTLPKLRWAAWPNTLVARASGRTTASAFMANPLEGIVPPNRAPNSGTDRTDSEFPAKFVVLDYGDQGGLDSYLRSSHMADIQSGKLAVYRFETTDPFHVEHAKNIAARCGILEGADILVTLDADNYTGPGFARFIADKFRDYHDRGVWGVFLCPNYVLIQSLPHGPTRPQRGYAGRLAIRSQDFIKLGAYDETFNTWRGEDIDMVCRLRRLGYTMRF